MKQNNCGFSLIETVVAIAILGAFSVSIATSLVLSLRMNEKTEALMQEQMAVSSAVETLMAEGIKEASEQYDILSENNEDKFSLVSITTETVTSTGDSPAVLPYFNVTVTSNEGNVSVTTQIRKAVDE